MFTSRAHKRGLLPPLTLLGGRGENAQNVTQALLAACSGRLTHRLRASSRSPGRGRCRSPLGLPPPPPPAGADPAPRQEGRRGAVPLKISLCMRDGGSRMEQGPVGWAGHPQGHPRTPPPRTLAPVAHVVSSSPGGDARGSGPDSPSPAPPESSLHIWSRSWVPGVGPWPRKGAGGHQGRAGSWRGGREWPQCWASEEAGRRGSGLSGRGGRQTDRQTDRPLHHHLPGFKGAGHPYP